MTKESTSPAATPTIAAAGMKLPPFWPADPEVWFTQVLLPGVSPLKRRGLAFIISSLSPEFTMEVQDLLLKPPTYKAQLIKRTAASEQRELQ